MKASSRNARRVARQPRIPRDAFDRLLDGEYPPHLGPHLRKLKTVDDKVSAVRARIATLDKSPDVQLPFERRILGAIEKDLRATAPRNFILHNENVFNLVGDIFDRLPDLEKAAPGISEGLTGKHKDGLRRRLRLAAFLHDTGKALEQSRHPILGWHVLLDLASVGQTDQKAKEVLLSKLRRIDPSRPEAVYRWLARLIRDHDKFGVISTGEASYVILGSLMRYGRGGTDTSLSQMRETWLLNLADIGGTELARPTRAEEKDLTPLERDLHVRKDKFAALTSDWTIVHQIVSGKPFAKALEALRQASETPEYTVVRIRRLLLERAGTWGTLANYFTEDLIEDTLETHFAPRDLLSFCRELGMVAKLDYALQFWNELADYLYIKLTLDRGISQKVYDKLLRVPGDWTTAFGDYNFDRDPSSWYGEVAHIIRGPDGADIQWQLAERARQEGLEERIAREQADLLIAILRRVVVAYRGLIRGSNIADTAAIGVGFSYLRSDEREKRLALYELLTGRGRERGLRWLIDEIASWDMLA
jgi:hypothetical protein